jgi:Prion-inhibition and propagation
MAEAAGLLIGAISLAGLFTNCVNCFEYVQLGRNFGKDYERSLLKLDIVKLRLSRWADAVNESQNRSRNPVGSANVVQKVEEILGEIIELFADAEKVSVKYKTKGTSGELGVYNIDTDLESDLQSMHNKMRVLALKRQRRSSFAQKAAWALY